MANNRLLLVCDVCKGADKILQHKLPWVPEVPVFYLAKRFMDGYYNARTDLGDELSSWFDAHSHLDEGSQDHFSLHYEIDKNYDMGQDR